MKASQLTPNESHPNFSDTEISDVLKSVTPEHPALRRVHDKLNRAKGVEAAITSYDRMHHRHNRS